MQNSINKIFLSVLTIVVATAIALPFSYQVRALTANPNSGSFVAGSSTTINLTANPQGTESGIDLNLQAAGMIITGYTAPSGFLVVAACPGSVNFTATTVCVGLSKSSGNLVTGESLGSITVTFDNVATATITKLSTNVYASGTTREDSGLMATFTRATGSSGTLPNTSKEENGLLDSRLITVGLVVVVTTSLLIGYFVLTKKKKI